MKKPKIIVWGYDNNRHTQYYLHWGWYNTFKSLGYDTYWFSDENHPNQFDYSNCLFIAEGYADNNIPLHKTSTYFVNFLKNPLKYIDAGVRIIDIRLNVNEINDYNYNYVLNDLNTIKIGNCAYYEEKSGDSSLSDHHKKGIDGYESVYLSWATHLLPEEINLDDAHIKRENHIYWTGSISEGNGKEMELFVKAVRQENIGFTHINPWSNPASWEDLKRLTQISIIAPDIRGSAMRQIVSGKPDNGANHKYIGYLPCRIFKNVSFGQLGITNSKAVYELFDGNVIYNDNEYDLFYDSMSQKDNIKMIKEQMLYVKENHTFVDRINSLMKIYYKNI